MAPNPEGSLALLMDALYALEQTVHTDLVTYRWRPQSTPDLPAIWNWLLRAPKTDTSTIGVRDTLHLLAVIGIRHTNVDEQMADVETYGDAFRAVVDPAMMTNQPLSGAATKATRSEMRNSLDEFGPTGVFCVEFELHIQLDRIVHPNLT